MENQFERVINVLGEENLEKLQNSHVVLFGLGGVGSFSAEALVRSGIGKMTIVDSDKVEPSNLNRQLEAVQTTVGQDKTDALKERMVSINPDIQVICKKILVDGETVVSCFDSKPDYVIDAIDDSEGKLAIWKYCQNNGIPFIACLGTARKLNPEKLIVTTLNKTEKDPLAKKLRYLARRGGIDMKLKVVCSAEEALPMNESGVLGSMIFVPATAGLICRKECIKEIIDTAE